MSYGVFDTKDSCWMGTEEGVIRYEEELHARAAATVINEQFGETIRFRARKLERGSFTQRDMIEAKMTGAEAIKRIEERA